MTDTEIVTLFFSRQEQAILCAQQQYGSYCRSLIRRILGCREDTEECMNDLWLKAWASIPPNEPKDLKLYLAKIGRNLACSRLREQTADKRSAQAIVLLEELEECLPGGHSAEEEVYGLELRQTINTFLQELPRRECDMFIRRYFYAEAIGDIAGRYGLRENSVCVTLHRTRAKLRDYLKQEGYQ